MPSKTIKQAVRDNMLQSLGRMQNLKKSDPFFKIADEVERRINAVIAVIDGKEVPPAPVFQCRYPGPVDPPDAA